MEEDDFLWECAFKQEKKDRLWIIPDKEEFQLDDHPFIHQEYQIIETIEANKNESNEIKVVVKANSGDGVFDIIGGEVWEASLLLSSYLFLNKERYISVSSNFLELGSGIGLPSFILTNLLLHETRNCRLSQQQQLEQPLITLTDYESNLLENLRTIIERRYHHTRIKRQDFDEDEEEEYRPNGKLKISVSSLDWSKIAQNPHQHLLSRDDYDFLIGSALCYAPYHSQCLLEVVKYFLLGQRLQEILICQIKDREGFPVFLDLLKREVEGGGGIRFSVEEISKEVYEYANRISCEKELLSCQRRIMKEEVRKRSKMREEEESLEEVETELWLSYYFPTSNIIEAEGGERRSRNLVTTSVESFVLVRIFPFHES